MSGWASKMAVIPRLNNKGVISDLSLVGGTLTPSNVPTNHSNQPITATYQSGQLTNQSPRSDEPQLQPSTYDLHRPKEPIDKS